MTWHPHAHVIVTGGGISIDGEHWIECRKGFFLSVNVLAMLFRRLFLEKLMAAFDADKLQFFGDLAGLAEPAAFKRHLAPVRKIKWHVYAKRPFAGPDAVLAYLSRYTHRIAISNSRLIAMDETGVTFRYKDYRAEGKERMKVMTLSGPEFIRRFLLHVVPDGFHRIRHYGLLANGNRAANLAKARELLGVPPQEPELICDDATEDAEAESTLATCPCCGGRMHIIERFERGCLPRHQPCPPTRIDTSLRQRCADRHSLPDSFAASFETGNRRV